MEGWYIVWDTKTGVYDGAYREKLTALDRYFAMSREDRDGKWLLVQVVHHDSGASLADEKFHALQKEKLQ